jgi:multidrug efflux pump
MKNNQRRFTDIFIERPVLATVVSLLILVLGLRAASLLPIRQFPLIQDAVITVSTAYTGADPELIAGFITTPLENAVAQADGIDYLSSSSTQGSSSIEAKLRLNYDPNKALTEINTKVNSVLNQLPPEALKPTMSIVIGQSISAMYLGFYSKTLAANQITDYLLRIVQPKLQAIPGVQQATILGQRLFALRAWLDPVKLAAHHLTAADIHNALANNNFIAAVGRTAGDMITINLTADTGLTNLDEFRNLIVNADHGAIVRLKDVAQVSLGSSNYNTTVKFDNKPAVYIGINVMPDANVLTVVQAVNQIFPEIVKQLPEGLNANIVYDATKYINSSIHEVLVSLAEALLIVTGVVFLFLGSVRSVIIPVVAIPLSLIGSFFIMYVLGYTFNLLTLLSMVLAIGLVVDDAIIIVENIHRHLEEKISIHQAALEGTRQLAIPIIAISVVLIAVYIPIGFMGGLTGALFTEFAFSLAGAVGVSAVIALTLSPMMCSKFLYSETMKSGFAQWMDQFFEKTKQRYERVLHHWLDYLSVTVVFSAIILTSIYFLYTTSQTELAPHEDTGILIGMLTAAPNATLEQTQLYGQQMYRAYASFPETGHVFQIDGSSGLNSSLAGMVLTPWDQRKRTAETLQPQVQNLLNNISGAKSVVFQPPPLPGAGRGLGVQVLVTTTDDYLKLNEVVQNLITQAQRSGYFMYLDSNLKIDKPQDKVDIDREKAAQMGFTMTDIGRVLAAALSEAYVNYFNFSGRSYEVIPQVLRQHRSNADQILNYYLTTASGISIPLSTIATIKTTVIPESIYHFQQLNAAQISAVPMPGVTVGDALAHFQSIARSILPAGYNLDYAGEARQYQQEKSSFMLTFIFAMIIIFLCLAAQFESFRDPFIILMSVPMSICGALIFINLGLGGATLNIYTQIGLVTLIGLISKHGILIVQFANELQQGGRSKREAIEMAAGIRLRPILMTTAAMVLGVVPLILASGAGAVARYNIGLVIATGISIGTLFTLFVVPAMYLLLAATHQRASEPEPITRQL